MFYFVSSLESQNEELSSKLNVESELRSKESVSTKLQLEELRSLEGALQQEKEHLRNQVDRFDIISIFLLTFSGQNTYTRLEKGYLPTLHRLATAQNHYGFCKYALVVLESWDKELSNDA